MTIRCRYALEAGPALVVDLQARCDRPCPVNLTQHAYFNLDGSPDISGHRLSVHADRALPVDAALIPTGAPVPVDGTALDLRRPAPLDRTPPLDTCYVLDGTPAARLESPRAGLAMEVVTTKPAIQVYDARHLSMAPFGPRAGLCLETQFLPDSPNRPEFPDITLRPGQTYRHRTEFRFSWM
jgi:aldose 1-epimerase